MKTRNMTALALIAAFATPVIAADQIPVSHVDVMTDMSDPQSIEAMKRWPDVETDLEMAIAAKLLNPTERDTYKIDVSLVDVRVNDAPVLTDDGYFNTLSGVVTIRDDNFETVWSDPIIVRAVEGEEPVDGITYVTPDAEDFYTGLLGGYADATIAAVNTASEAVKFENPRN